MKEICSYEIAVALRDAGFPAPEKAPGQIRYRTRFPGGLLQAHIPFIILPFKREAAAIPMDGQEFVPPSHTDVYCPSVDDMLSLLKHDFFVKKSFWGNEKRWFLMQDVHNHLVSSNVSLLNLLTNAFLGGSKRILFEQIEEKV